jgi:glutathione S-transferase
MNEQELILHHYAGSPFSEKVRLILGFKNLAWRSVTIPIVMPKPDVIALTGGYRRTPLLQIGADIYCDSALIARALDRLAPQPWLYPESAAGARIVAQWADTDLFWTVIPFLMQQPAAVAAIFKGAPPEMAEAFRADRAAFAPQVHRPTLADATAQLGSYLGWLDAMLADGRPFLCGSAASIADFSVVHNLWFLRLAAPVVAPVLEPHRRLAAWFERMQAFGRGRKEPMGSDEAIALAAVAKGHAPAEVSPGAGFEAGDEVVVCATDYGKDPVAGQLVGLGAEEIVVARTDERAGRVHVHFPRIGFHLKKAKL